MDNKRIKILIIRFSAMGDVAMTAPIVKQIAQQNPQCDFVYLSRPFFKPFFSDIPNLEFFAFDKVKHKGLGGLYDLFKQLKSLRINAIADLHFNLRSRIISLFFKATGVKVAHLNKDRAQKKALTKIKEKQLKPLTPMWQRYTEVFQLLSLKANINNSLQKTLNTDFSPFGIKDNNFWVGISPFAQHVQKVYPLDKMEQVIDELDKNQISTFIFGGGQDEKEVAENWQNKFKSCTSTIGKLNLQQELDFIPQLDLMISMDSAGMHLASLKGVKVLSIWGATHPFAGFLGFGQDMANCVQDNLYCRPCSVYGSKPCYRGDFACMNNIAPDLIVEKTINLLNNGKETTTSKTR